MANGKKPTRVQKQILEKHKLNPDNWLVIKNPPGELFIRHRVTKKQRVLKIV